MRLIDRALFPVALHSRDRHQTSDAARVTSTDDPSALHTFDGEVVRAAVAWVIAVGTDWDIGHRDLRTWDGGDIPMTPVCYIIAAAERVRAVEALSSIGARGANP
jgi:hypothetical protein